MNKLYIILIIVVVFAGCKVEKEVDMKCFDYCMENIGIVKTKDYYATGIQDCFDNCTYPYRIKF